MNTPGRNFTHYLCGCAIYKNEAPYLAEWLEFHRLVGFEKFFLYDNGSTDEHLDVLRPFVEDGFVEIKDWPIVPAQLEAYDHCLKRARHQTRWLAFFDVDEFCYSPLGMPVPEVLGEYEAHPAINVGLVVFGTSGHDERPAGPVISNYVMREQEARSLGKCIADPLRTVECLGAHRFRYLQNVWPGIWVEVPVINERHEEMDYSKPGSVEKLRINHYYFKSEREATAKFKQDYRAFGRYEEDHGAPRTRDQRILKWRNLANAVTDTDIQMYLPDLRQALRDET